MGGAIDAQALGDLMDGDDGGFAAVIAQLERDLEQKDELARRLRDQCRYQHLVLAEIYQLSDPDDVAVSEGNVPAIRCKSRAALAAASKSGLLA